MKITPSESSEKTEPEIGILECTPFLTPEQLSAYTKGMDAVILIAFATGTTPDRLAPVIKERVAEGTPIILLTNNPADSAGPFRLAYAAGQSALEAGAVLLQKVNVNHAGEVKEAIKKAFAGGLRGHELSEYIQNLYSYHEGEQPTLSEWSQAEGIEWQRQHTQNAFRRIGFKGKELEEVMRQWESGYPNPETLDFPDTQESG